VRNIRQTDTASVVQPLSGGHVAFQMTTNYNLAGMDKSPWLVDFQSQKKSFPLVFKMKVIEMYKHEWYDTVSKSTVMDLYKFFKPDFGYEMYLDVLPKSLRIFFSRLRMSVHPLRIQTGRYTNDNRPRNERYCMVCNLHDIEDEYHFICICPCFSNVRKQYIDKKYYVKPSVYKYLQLLTTVDKQELINISLYVKHALLMRSNITYTER